VWSDLRAGVRPPGGIVGYPLERVFEEVAFVAYHFHWDRDTLLDMTHRERHVWVREVSDINARINKSRGG